MRFSAEVTFSCFVIMKICHRINILHGLERISSLVSLNLAGLLARLSPGSGSQSAHPISCCATVESSLLSRLGINSSSVENYTWYIF